MNNLKVIENELVPVYQTDTGQKIVYGTELHTVLEVKSKFADWVKNRLNDCDAVENKDFEAFSKILEKGHRPQTEYIIQLATAKEMAMLERNDKGREVRRYFIKVEEKYKEVVQKKMLKLISMADVEEKEASIRLFKTEEGGIVLLDDNVYSLTTNEIEMLSKFIPEMEKYNIGQVQYAVQAFLKSMKKNGRLEEIASWGVKEEKPQVPLLPDKAKQKQADIKDYNAPFITTKQAQSRYNMSYGKVAQLAKESGAWIKYGKATRINTKKMDEYLTKEYTE